MKKHGLRRSAAPAAVCAGLCLTGTAYAQITPGQQDQLRQFFGNRAEVGIILGASDSAGGGNYTVDGKNGNDDLEFSLYKFGGSGLIGEPRALGDSGVRWSPMLMGTFGYITGDHDIDAGPLAGSDIEESALGIQFGGGVAFHLNDRFTITPYVGVIYGHYEVDFDARTPAGEAVADELEDGFDTIGATPGIALEYALPVGRNTITFGGRYTYFGTTDISSDTDVEVGGDSHILEQRVDFDVPLNAELFGCRLHTGGYVALTEALGDIKDTMDSDVWATIHPRLLLDTTGKLWKVERMGLGFSYIKGDNFDGWDVGIDMSFKF